VEITHAYEGLARIIKGPRQGVPRFASFVASQIDTAPRVEGTPATIVELGVGSGQQTGFVTQELEKRGWLDYRIVAYDKSYQRAPGGKPGQLNVLEERIASGELSNKIVPVHFDFDGHALPLEAGTVRFCYMAHVFPPSAEQAERA